MHITVHSKPDPVLVGLPVIWQIGYCRNGKDCLAVVKVAVFEAIKPDNLKGEWEEMVFQQPTSLQLSN